MKFCEAMELLKNGSKVTRHPWQQGVYFLIVNGDVKSFQPHLTPYIYNEDIMVSDGWIVEGIEEELKFCNIITHLRNGLKAKLKDWNETFIYFDHQTKLIVCQSMNLFPFIPDFESFIAEDWIEIS